MEQTLSFDVWRKACINSLVTDYHFSPDAAREHTDADNFREYYDEGMPPGEAILEDISSWEP